MKNNSFYISLISLIFVITLILLYINPFTFFTEKQLSNEASYLMEIIRINTLITNYYKIHNSYPEKLEQIYIRDKNILKLIEYKKMGKEYYLKTLKPVNDTILIFYPNKIEKRVYEK